MHRARKRKVWQFQEAKTHFSKLIDEVIHNGYRTITRNGEPVVVVISYEEFERSRKPKDTLVDFFGRSPFSEHDLDIERDKNPGRDIDI